jgi:hypothetical protein
MKFPASILVPAGEKYHFDQNRHLLCIKGIVYQIGNFANDFAFLIFQVLSSVLVTINAIPLLSNALNSSIYFP